jgi:hypothetical protein
MSVFEATLDGMSEGYAAGDRVLGLNLKIGLTPWRADPVETPWK